MSEESQQFEPEPDVEAHALHVEHGDARGRLALQMMRQVRDSMNHVIQLLEEGDTARATRQLVDLVSHKRSMSDELEDLTGARVLEGVFDGQFMVGSDGVRYKVSENYASKSKMVEGDILKLTIKADGTYLYKQIGPISRKRLIGRLGTDSSTNEAVVICGDDVYKVLTASVSYFKGVPGDEVVVLVPESDRCIWAAVDNIVRGT
ncbi:hypothetical protein HOI18_00830 [Candidatus Uhrbacteria bacterium]|jgi:hypothetical protein|nr:hypothetical protein [Candidatus Uhrbacteria bacterium]